MPNVTLLVGIHSNTKPLSTSHYVHETNEVLLQCIVASNPASNRIRWFYNGKEFKQDITKGNCNTVNVLLVLSLTYM